MEIYVAKKEGQYYAGTVKPTFEKCLKEVKKLSKEEQEGAEIEKMDICDLLNLLLLHIIKATD